MKIYKLNFLYDSIKKNDRLDCTITGVLSLQIRKTFYKILENDGYKHDDILKLWSKLKVNIKVEELVFPKVITIPTI